MTVEPRLAEISTPEWNAPSPLNGSMRSPKLPVIWPSTGHRLGAELAPTHSAVVELLVRPMEIPTLAAPVRAVLRSAYNCSREESTCAFWICSVAAATIAGLDLSP